MSNILAQTYEGAVVPTQSDTAPDPKGPFAALLVSIAGTLKITPISGPAVAFTVIAGQYVLIATRQVWSTGTTATVIGLIALPYRAGAY